jgi:hypothetical protein
MALNITYAILGTAAICTGMVMDEEVLVLYAFILFVGLAYHYGSSVVNDTIQTEASKIGKEFDVFFDVQKKLIKTLITYHVLQVLVISQIQSLLEFSKTEITKVIAAKKLSLDFALSQQMEQKLSYLAAKEQSISMKVQSEASTHITAKIESIFATDNAQSKAIKEKFLVENMKKLETL